MDVKPEPKSPVYLEWVTAAHNFDREVWPALCLQAYDLYVFPHSHFYPKTLQLIPTETFGGISYEKLRDALRKVWFAMQRGDAINSEWALTFKAKWISRKQSVGITSYDHGKVLFEYALLFHYRKKGKDMEHKFVKVAINTDPQSSRLTRSHITDTKAIVVVDFFIDWTSDSNSAYSPKSKRFPKADTVKLESSAQGSSIDSSMAAVSAKFSQLNLAAEASPTPKLRQKSNAQPRVRHRSDPKAIEEKWTADEDAKLMELKNGKVVLWSDVANRFPNKSIGSLLQRHAALVLKGHSQPHASTSANSVSETNDVSAAAQMSRTAVESIDAKCGALTNSAAAAVGKTMQEHCGSTTPVPQAQSKTVDIIEDVAQIDSHDKTQSKDGEEHEAAEWGQWDVVEEENEPEWELVAA